MAERKALFYVEQGVDRFISDILSINELDHIQEKGLKLEDIIKKMKEDKQFAKEENLIQLFGSIPTPWAKLYVFNKILEMGYEEAGNFFEVIAEDYLTVIYLLLFNSVSFKKIKVDDNDPLFKDPYFKKEYKDLKELEIVEYLNQPIAAYSKSTFIFSRIIYSDYEGLEDLLNKAFLSFSKVPEECRIDVYLFLEYIGDKYKKVEELKNYLIDKGYVSKEKAEQKKANYSFGKPEKEGIEEYVKKFKEIVGIKEKHTDEEFILKGKFIIFPRKGYENRERKILGKPCTMEGIIEIMKNYSKFKEDYKDYRIITDLTKYFVEREGKVVLIRGFNDKDYLLPLKYEDLEKDFENDEELIEKILNSAKIDGNKFVLHIDNKDWWKFEKDYRELNFELDDLIVGICPSFEGFNEYYLVIWSKGAIKVEEAHIPNKGQEDKKVYKNFRLIESEEGDILIYRLNKMPKYIGLKMRYVGELHYGIVKITKKEFAPKEKKVIFAIDIGTTNTIIKYKEKGGEPEIFKINELVNFVIPSEIPKEKKEYITKLFSKLLLPKEFEPFDSKNIGFFRTRYYVFDTSKKSNEYKNFLDGHLMLWKGEIFDEQDKARVREEDIKWGTGANEELFKKYLENIEFFIKGFKDYYGYNEIEIRCSYPTALPGNRRLYLEDKKEKDGWVIHPEAVAIYYGSKAFNADVGCAVDIGGGTTDFCIWKDKKIVFHYSLKFAGNDIIRDSFKDLNMYDKFVEEVKNGWNNVFDTINKNKELHYLVAFKYLALFTTINLFVRHYIGESDQPNEKNIAIFLLGNGSRFMENVLIGHLPGNEELYKNKAIKELVEETLGKIEVTIETSDKPKHEVVDGLLNEEIKSMELTQEVFKYQGQDKDFVKKLSAILGPLEKLGLDEEGFAEKGKAEEIEKETENSFNIHYGRELSDFKTLQDKGSCYSLEFFKKAIEVITKKLNKIGGQK